jgi:hypothetical protein
LIVFVPLILFAHLLSSSAFAFLAGNFRRQTNTTITTIIITTTTPTIAPMIAAVFLLFDEAWHRSNGLSHSPGLPAKFDAEKFFSVDGIGPDSWLSATLNAVNRVRRLNCSGIGPLNWLCWRLRVFRYVMFDIFCGRLPEKLL